MALADFVNTLFHLWKRGTILIVYSIKFLFQFLSIPPGIFPSAPVIPCFVEVEFDQELTIFTYSPTKVDDS